MAFARSVANKVVFMADQGIYEEGPPEQVFDAPQKEKTRTFVNKLKVLEEELTAGSLDVYAFMSRVRQYCVPYGFSSRQMNLINSVCDELVIPILRAQGGRILFRLRCSEKTSFKDVYLGIPGLAQSPLEHPAVDELGVRILRGLMAGETCEVGPEGALLHLTIAE